MSALSPSEDWTTIRQGLGARIDEIIGLIPTHFQMRNDVVMKLQAKKQEVLTAPPTSFLCRWSDVAFVLNELPTPEIAPWVLTISAIYEERIE